ncbi:MAG: type IV secretion system DNA-binding domain-containing protein [Parcubacteria group bacterium]|nr:type IV secretion system DNA-binding domain-containing protein [Parcubacteria group bacterium]
MSDSKQVTYFAETDFRNKKQKFGIKASDRTRHMYVIGKTGMGKSTLLENMAVQDILNGNGVAVMDPHGSFAEKILEYVPEERINDVIYFAPFDMEHPMSFNVMEDVGYDKRHLVVSGLMSAFEKIWADAWSARMAYILQNTLFALLEYPDSTLLDINKMLVNKTFRKEVVENVTDPSVKSFWVDEFAKYTDRYAQEATPAIQNKIGQFTSNPLIRNIVGQPESSFDIRTIMDEKKILIMNLSKGRIGEGNTNLLGSMLITKIYLAAMSRADAENITTLPNFYFFVDEFQSFANKSFADILSEARKYKFNLTIAHQYVEQMEEEVRSAVFGNVGTMITFRVGSFDAEIFEKEFAPQFTSEDIVNLGFAQVYLRLMIDGVGSKPFSARTLPPISLPAISMKQRAIEMSRKNFGKPRAQVEKKIDERQATFSESAGQGSIKKGEKKERDTRTQGGASQSPKSHNRGSTKDERIPFRQSSEPSETARRSEKRRQPSGRQGFDPARQERPMKKAIEHAYDEYAKTTKDPRSKEILSHNVAQKRFEKKENVSPKPISLSALPQKKQPESENKLKLKSVLSEAMKSTESSPLEPRTRIYTSSAPKKELPVKEKDTPSKDQKEERMIHDTPDTADTDDVQLKHTPREVPEKVLRDVLKGVIDKTD